MKSDPPPCRPLAALLLAFFLAACSETPPAHFHTLDVGSGVPDSGQAERLVETLPVSVPERIDRPQMVFMDRQGRLDFQDDERWAAPLSSEIRARIDAALWRRLKAADIYDAPPPAIGPLPHYRLAVHVDRLDMMRVDRLDMMRVDRLDMMKDGQAVLEAGWTVRQLPSGPLAACRLSILSPAAGSSPDALAVAMAGAVSELADGVAASLAGLGSSKPCPERP